MFQKNSKKNKANLRKSLPAIMGSNSNVLFWVLILAVCGLAAAHLTNIFQCQKNKLDKRWITQIEGERQETTESPKEPLTEETGQPFWVSKTEAIIRLMTSSTAPSLNGRKLVTYQDIYVSDQNPLFLYEWNSATAVQVKSVTAQEIGIQFEVPYNNNWGNRYFAVAPSEKDSDQSSEFPLYRFGFIRFVRGEGSDFVRQYMLNTMPKLMHFSEEEVRSAEDLTAFIQERFRGGVRSDPQSESIEITPQRINGLLTARVDITVDCETHQSINPCGTFVEYYVVGPKGVGVFRERDDFPENLVEFQNIIRSIRPL